MFDIGFGEMVLLAAIALIAIGPKQLPEVARVVGRFINDVKRMTGEFSRSFTDVRDTAARALMDEPKHDSHHELHQQPHHDHSEAAPEPKPEPAAVPAPAEDKKDIPT